MKKILMVIAPENFRDEELFHTKEEIEKAGHKITIVSTKKEESTGMLGGKAIPEKTIDEINENDFKAVIFVGGSGASIYFDNNRALEIAKKFHEKNKVVAAICIAPSILANAGILKNKKATCWESESENLNQKGAECTKSSVEIDGNIITANGPKAAREFGKKIAEMV